jgi:hypothetical protein
MKDCEYCTVFRRFAFQLLTASFHHLFNMEFREHCTTKILYVSLYQNVKHLAFASKENSLEAILLLCAAELYKAAVYQGKKWSYVLSFRWK